MKNSTNSSEVYYRRLSILAFLLMAVLILIQINWLTKAVSLQQEQSHAQLQKLVPDIALSINEIDHNMFHDTLLNLSSLDLELVGYKVDSLLELHGIKQEVVFSLYKEGKQNIFLANETAYKEELLRSDIKSCMSCIVSFSIVRDTSGLGKRGDEGFEERLMERSEFQYYSPVSNAKERKGEILWFSLYQPSPLSAAIESLIFMFSLSLILLLVLLGLFFHVLRSLSRHKKLSQVKNDFFNNVSHEFKTPLSSIRLASKVLQKSKNPEKNLIYHQLIEKESLLLEQEIDKLLELSLLDNKELPFEFEEVNLRQIIAEIPKRLKLLIEEKHAKLELDLEEDIRPLKGDPTHLSNSFCNLVENSLKYSADEVEVHISSTHEGKHHTIRIRDNGPGIKAEFQDQIFDRFFRGQKNDQYKGQGFGIGLSYVKSVIEAHKGSIQLNKTYTEGTEFIIKLSYA